MLLSARQSLSSGNLTGTAAHNQSTNAAAELLDGNAWSTASGASADVFGNCELDPTCTMITVRVSSHTAKNGSQ